jgi:hypothetical protein
MWMTVGERRFAITLTNNAAARAFAAQLPLTLDMSELNGNEKHGELPRALPAKASRPGTIRNGDLMLYGRGAGDNPTDRRGASGCSPARYCAP